MAKSITLFISGSSGAGKNTIINGVMENRKDCEFIVSNTTREQRPTDRKVGQYKFVSKEEFEQKIANNDILEYDIFNDNYYGISKKDIVDNANNGKVLLKDLTVKGVINCRELLKDIIPMVSIFLTQKKSVLKQRLIGRGEKPESIKNRLKVYKQEQKMIPFYDYLLYNVDVNQTVKETNAIINIVKNDLPILTNKNCQGIVEKKIDKYINKIEKGKKLREILVGAYNDRIYILEGANKYLAYLKAKKRVCLHFVTPPIDFVPDEKNNEEWLKLLNSYK